MDFWFDLIETLADAVLTLLEEFPINRLTRRAECSTPGNGRRDG